VPSITSTCTTITVSLTGYPSTEAQPTPNRAIVTIDDVAQPTELFGDTLVREYEVFPYAVHTWSVYIDALGASFDPTFTGVTSPCEPPRVIQDAAAAVAVSDPTCDSAAILTLLPPANATWGVPTATVGPADYEVTAWAVDGHAFASGESTSTITGTLAGPLDPDSEECAPDVPVVPPQPAATVTVEHNDAVDCDSTTVTTTTTTTTIGSVLNAEGTAWVPAAPVVVVTQSTRATTLVECPAPAVPVDPEDPVDPVDPADPIDPGTSVPTALAHNGVDVEQPLTIAFGFAIVGGALLLKGPRRRTIR
jgi:hypothetical protein